MTKSNLARGSNFDIRESSIPDAPESIYAKWRIQLFDTRVSEMRNFTLIFPEGGRASLALVSKFPGLATIQTNRRAFPAKALAETMRSGFQFTQLGNKYIIK